MANSGRWASRCALHTAPCSIRAGTAIREAFALPQSVICRVGDQASSSVLLQGPCRSSNKPPTYQRPHLSRTCLTLNVAVGGGELGLERPPGGAYPHWKAPPFHGA